MKICHCLKQTFPILISRYWPIPENSHGTFWWVCRKGVWWGRGSVYSTAKFLFLCWLTESFHCVRFFFCFYQIQNLWSKKGIPSDQHVGPTTRVQHFKLQVYLKYTESMKSLLIFYWESTIHYLCLGLKNRRPTLQ